MGLKKLEGEKCGFQNNALSLGESFWCARQEQFRDLYCATLITFAEGFAPFCSRA